jgi:hypothetical protein
VGWVVPGNAWHACVARGQENSVASSSVCHFPRSAEASWSLLWSALSAADSDVSAADFDSQLPSPDDLPSLAAPFCCRHLVVVEEEWGERGKHAACRVALARTSSDERTAMAHKGKNRHVKRRMDTSNEDEEAEEQKYLARVCAAELLVLAMVATAVIVPAATVAVI